MSAHPVDWLSLGAEGAVAYEPVYSYPTDVAAPPSGTSRYRAFGVARFHLRARERMELSFAVLLGYAANVRDVYSTTAGAVVRRTGEGVGTGALVGLHFLLSPLISVDTEFGALVIPLDLAASKLTPAATIRLGLGVHFR